MGRTLWLALSLLAVGCPRPQTGPYLLDLREANGCGDRCGAIGFWSESTPIDPNGDPEEQPEQTLYRFFFSGSVIAVHNENARDRPAAPVDEAYYICLTRWTDDDLLQCEWSQGEWIDMAYFDTERDAFYERSHSGTRFYFERERTLPELGLPHAQLLRVYLQVGTPADGEGHIYLPRGNAPRPEH
jgi:hypothetical protein